MWSKIISFLVSLFKKTESPPSPDLSIDPVPPQQLDILSDYTYRALLITQQFEGNIPWANITGNFDGAGLTCGALGWTIQWLNQQPLVKAFVTRNGIEKAKSYMPKMWDWYWELITIRDDKEAIKMANEISGMSQKVREPYYSELVKFWSSPEMVQIQKEFAIKNMGIWAMERAKELNEMIPFKVFAYFFDQAVLNGKGKNPTLDEAKTISTDSVFYWMENESGYGQKDFDKNVLEWKKHTSSASPEDLILFSHAKLRADRAREDFDTITLSRRGILIFGTGYLNGKYWDIRKELGIT